MTSKRRNSLILLFVAGLVAASLAVLATQPTKLGLDLKGGVELVYQGQPTPQSKVDTESINRAIEIMRNRVDALGVSEPEIQRSGGNQITVGLPSVTNVARAQEQVGSPAQLVFYDWEKNVYAPNGRLAAPQLPLKDPGAMQVMNSAGDPSGGMDLFKAVTMASGLPTRSGIDISRTGPQYWLFNADGKQLLAGPDTSLKDIKSNFKDSKIPAGAKLLTVPQGTVVLQAVYRKDKTPTDLMKAKWYVLRDNVALFGKEITDPKQGTDSTQGTPDVEFKFTDKGQKAFQDTTREIAQRGQALSPIFSPLRPVQHFAVALDRDLISVASVDYTNLPDGIDGRNGAVITGGFTIQGAQDLARLLELGALPINLKLISQSTVSATLGKQALNQGLLAGVAGLIMVMLFLLGFYRVLGLIACGALIVYSLYLFALVKLIPITMTLPGIAGLILTIGVAADANVVIFERVKEEIRGGRSITAGIAQGYKKGLSAIIDANVVTLMTAFILFVLATSGVKGFAFTLGVGTIVSLLTAVVATQAALTGMGTSRLVSSPSALGAANKTREWKYDFMGASRWFFSISGAILMVGALAIGGKGLNFGIDFTSGTRIVTSLAQPANDNQVRDVLATLGVNDAKIQRVNNKDLGPNGFQISTKELKQENVVKVDAALAKAFGATKNFNSESVGPTFGKTVADSALIAIIASLLVISAYIALRFEWKFAVPVLIALMHDLLITAGVYALTGLEVTTATVAALLTILGYSLYDTIIVFDRVRENTPRMPRAAFSQIVNRSMSEVLTRSLATSFCTLIPVASLLVFGGATLKNFAFALLVGVASGAYSSIFIASPVLTYWKDREPGYAKRAARQKAAGGGSIPAYYQGISSDTAAKLDEAAAKPAVKRPVGPDGMEQLSADEFARMTKEVAEDLAVEPVFEHAPDEAESDDATGSKSSGERRRNKRHGRNR